MRSNMLAVVRATRRRVAHTLRPVVAPTIKSLQVLFPTVFAPRLTVSVVRPQDLLSLRFELLNFTLMSDDEQAYAVRSDPLSPAYIIVHFAPQNVAEQAFFEVAPSITTRGATPGDLDEGNLTSDALSPPPVQSRIAGPSRLVFKVPPGIQPIPYTLEGLLQACGEYELSVAPTALPPRQISRYPAPSGLPVRDASLHAYLQRPATETPPARAIATQTATRSSPVLEVARTAPPASRAQALIQKSQERSWRRADLLSRYLGRAEYAAIEQQLPKSYLTALVERPPLTAPTKVQTALELPFRLILSPNRFGAWVHARRPVASPTTGRTELWHTRLAVRLQNGVVDEAYAGLRTLRAIWARSGSTPNERFNPNDAQDCPPHANLPFRMSLDAFDRHNLVHLSANFGLSLTGGTTPRSYEPRPIDVERLMLTSLGAWINARGAWTELPQGLSVEEWRQRGTTGRDHYVRVVYAGFLFPFGHRASLVKVTERKFGPGNVAYLFQRMFIVVREPERFFGDSGLRTVPAPGQAIGKSYDLQMPFKRVEITTLVTPNLNPPEQSDYPENPPAAGLKQSIFWPRVGNEDFQFHLRAEDAEGNVSELTAPLLFIGKEIVDNNNLQNYNLLQSAIADYETSNTGKEPQRRMRPLQGQTVVYAASNQPGDTQFETDTVTFGAELPPKATYDTLPRNAARFFPVVRKAQLRIPAAKHLTGNMEPGEMQYHAAYLQHGFDALLNKGQVFAALAGIGLDFATRGDRAGGLVQPNMQITGLSRMMGPIAGNIDNLTSGTFDPADFFAGLPAKLFGVIDLWDVIEGVAGDFAGQALDHVPKFITEALTSVQALLADLARLQEELNTLSTLGGMVQADVNNLLADVNNLLDDLDAIIGNLPDPPAQAQRDALAFHLDQFSTHLNTLLASLPADSNIASDVKQAIMPRLQSFANDLKQVNAFVDRLVDALQIPKELKIRFEWKPVLKSWPAPSPLFIASNNGTPASLVIAAELRAQTNLKAEPVVDIRCRLDNFAIDLLGNVESFIILHFTRVEFRAPGGKKVDIDVVLERIEFVGVLSFVEALRSLIPLDGFSDPPTLDVSERGIDARYSLGLPNLAFGVFSLQNLSLGAGFTIPFIGEPLSVRFNFCERQSPFLLTVSMFGGGGFFGITVDPAGVQLLEASFEFGASVSVNFGVASGGVYVTAGIYFRLEQNKAALTGYFRLGGALSVLGIITVSVELYLGLVYEFSSGKCVGEAVLTIEVEVLMFSKTVEIRCQRKFAGSNGDPTFAQLMEPYAPDPAEPEILVDPWAEYCDAFAD